MARAPTRQPGHWAKGGYEMGPSSGMGTYSLQVTDSHLASPMVGFLATLSAEVWGPIAGQMTATGDISTASPWVQCWERWLGERPRQDLALTAAPSRSTDAAVPLGHRGDSALVRPYGTLCRTAAENLEAPISCLPLSGT